MNRTVRSILLVLGWGWLTSCALQPPTPALDVGQVPRGRSITLTQATEAIEVGRTHRDDLIRAFGDTSRVRFESGYEVLVYPLLPDTKEAAGGARSDAGKANTTRKTDTPTGEFVVLVAPDGNVVKTRVRLPAVPQ